MWFPIKAGTGWEMINLAMYKMMLLRHPADKRWEVVACDSYSFENVVVLKEFEDMEQAVEFQERLIKEMSEYWYVFKSGYLHEPF